MSDMTKYKIVNTTDRPSEKLIAELRDDGRLYYVHPDIADDPKFADGMDASEATTVMDFGISLVEKNGFLWGTRVRASSAEYRDGRPRNWQGSDGFHLPLPAAKAPANNGDTRTTMSSAQANRLNRISMEAHGVTGMLNAVLEAAPSYSHSQLLRVIKTAHDRLETACRREDREVRNG